MAEILQKLYKEYKEAVSQNSSTIAQFESVFRLISYVIAGRFEDSTILSELFYSASNLLVLFNDAILKKASGIIPSVSTSKERLQSLVTVLEYVGVFVELAATRLFGEKGRWVAITALQIAKCICRFLLLKVHRCGVQPVPPISPIDRASVTKQMKKKLNEQDEGVNNNLDSSNAEAMNSSSSSKTFTLQRSGKVMRTLSSAVPVNSRDWQLPKNDTARVLDGTIPFPTALSQSQRIGECLYIIKPLVHLATLYTCGKSSFKPWLISSSLDVTSLYLLNSKGSLKPEEREEVKRRVLMLFLYLLRSPFYDKYTKERLLQLLHRFSGIIPGLSFLIVPILDYLPVWQQIYFYTWSV